MNITIQISDHAYQQLLSSGSRLQGTIGLINPNEGNFNAHIRHTAEDGGIHSKHIRLRHGRVSVNEKRVRLTLHIGLDEAGIIPSEAIEDESREAGGFVDDYFHHYLEITR
ncbi:hypothetical protein [Parabacteroides sp.]